MKSKENLTEKKATTKKIAKKKVLKKKVTVSKKAIRSVTKKMPTNNNRPVSVSRKSVGKIKNKKISSNVVTMKVSDTLYEKLSREAEKYTDGNISKWVKVSMTNFKPKVKDAKTMVTKFNSLGRPYKMDVTTAIRKSK